MQFPRFALFCFILVAAPGWTAAGSLYRCIGAGGQVSYQDSTCDRRTRTERIIEYMPEPPSVAVVRARSLPEHVMRRPTRAQAIRHRAKDIRLTRSEECRRAKSRRTRQLERLGLARTYDQLSRIDVEVRSVCDGY